MKACVDCKHCYKKQYVNHVWTPMCDLFLEYTDKVTGEEHYASCVEARSDGEVLCGDGARFFKPTLGARLIHLFTGEDF